MSMIALYIFLLFTGAVWIHRAALMIGSIKKYSCIPIISWNPSETQEKVSVIVPCRNEAHNIDKIVSSLLRQDYPNLELIFLNDRSTDDTLARLEHYQEQDDRITIINGKSLPEGWTGKNHAMHQCAQVATGKWLLFTDADTVHTEHSVTSALHYALERDLDLLTLSAKCTCKTFGEHLVQPFGIGCFSVWFRLEVVNDPKSSVPLCCGQYLMVAKEAYQKVGGSESVKSEVTEDLALFKVMKDAGLRCELAIGAHLFATRMYRSFRESWIGWRRIYLHALEKNVPSLLRKMAMLLFYSITPFLILAGSGWGLIQGNGELWILFGLSLGLCGFILFLRSKSHEALKADQWSIFLHPFSAVTVFCILIDCLFHHFTDRKVVWKAQKY